MELNNYIRKGIMFRKTTEAENQMILDWINDKFYTDYESIQELLDTDIDELSEIMYECAFSINRLLHYDNHDIYVEETL